MDQFLYQELEESKRAINLEAISEGVVTMDYAVVLTMDEMTARKSQLTALVIQESKINDKKAEMLAKFKAELKPIEVEKHAVLQELKAGSIQENGICYKVVEQNTKMVGFYNVRGQLVSMRPMTQEDGQQVIKMAVNY